MTTPEVKSCCDDLKVLGKGDFKALLKWRIALREEVRLQLLLSALLTDSLLQLGIDVKSKDTEDLTETVEITEEVDEEQQISDEVCPSSFLRDTQLTPGRSSNASAPKLLRVPNASDARPTKSALRPSNACSSA